MVNHQLNEVSSSDNSGLMDVADIFDTIQGEGPLVGVPAVFVRLAGCNLQCPQCDTDYTSDRMMMTPQAVLTRILDLSQYKVAGQVDRRLVVITGGEPFRQKNLGLLVNALLGSGYEVQIETNGTLYVPGPWDSVTIVCSPKTNKIHKDLRQYIDAYKYVISDRHVSDYDGLPVFAMGFEKLVALARPPVDFKYDIYVQPLDEQNSDRNEKNLQAAIHSCKKFGYTLCVQLHKIVKLP